MRIAVLDAFTADQGEDRWAPLRALGEVVVHPRTPAADVERVAAGCEALLTNKVVLDGSLIDRLDRLRYIGVMATGTNVVDLQACRVRGIAVTNVPGYSTDSVAQLVFAHLLHLVHDVAGHDARVKAGEWARSPDFCFFTRPIVELAGKTIAVVGHGAIGRSVARIAGAFGMRVTSAAVPGSPTPGREPLPAALAAADVVSLHCPLTEHTRHLVSRSFLAAMKPGAILINTGRGGLVDEAAVVEALASGRLGGAALDVLTAEPPAASNPLTDPRQPFANRVSVTPHIGWGTVEARARLVREVCENLSTWIGGRRRNRVD